MERSSVMLWYPVLRSAAHTEMLAQLEAIYPEVYAMKLFSSRKRKPSNGGLWPLLHQSALWANG